MIDRPTDREIVKRDDGRQDFLVGGEVVFRMIDDHDSEGSGSYAYRLGELVVEANWARANSELIDEYVDLAHPKQEFAGGAVYDIRRIGPAGEPLEPKDVPEIVAEIVEKVEHQSRTPGTPHQPVASPPVTPHLVFLPSGHGPPFGPGRPPAKLPGQLDGLPYPDHQGEPGYGVTVGVIDTGAFSKHPWWDGKERIVVRDDGIDDEPNPDFIPGDAPGTTKRSETSGHGTFINGVILRCAPGVTIVSRRVVGDGFGEFDEAKLVEVLYELTAMEKPVDLVNVSFGAYAPHDSIPVLLNAFLERRTGGKPVVVACAGNDSTNEPFFPAAHPEVVGVGAVEDTGDRAGFSNYGAWVDIYAPGVNLPSTFIDWLDADGNPEDPEQGPWATWSGTSFAAPVVCGMIAATMKPKGDAGPDIDVVAATTQVLQQRRRPQDLGPLVEPAFVVPLFGVPNLVD